jgi:hypothetical protein
MPSGDQPAWQPLGAYIDPLVDVNSGAPEGVFYFNGDVLPFFSLHGAMGGSGDVVGALPPLKMWALSGCLSVCLPACMHIAL